MKVFMRVIPFLLALSVGAFAQDAALSPDVTKPVVKSFDVEPGTHIPLSLINSVSTKHAAVGDRVYLETVFPILSGGRIVIPPGSYVIGTITDVVRPGKVKGRGEFYLRFDSLTLPNGVTRDFRARVSQLDDGRVKSSTVTRARSGAKEIRAAMCERSAKRRRLEPASAHSREARRVRQAWVRASERPRARRRDWRR
jgi:hypothetical protein